MTAQIFLVFEIWRFLYFSHNFKKKKIRYRETWMRKTRTSISQPYSGVLSGYFQELQIWRSIVTAQILLVFEKLRFL